MQYVSPRTSSPTPSCLLILRSNSLCGHRSLSNNVGRDKSCLDGLGDRAQVRRRGVCDDAAPLNGVLEHGNEVLGDPEIAGGANVE